MQKLAAKPAVSGGCALFCEASSWVSTGSRWGAALLGSEDRHLRSWAGLMAGASGCGTKDTLDSAVASLPNVGLKELTARVGSVLCGRGGSLATACASWGAPSKGLAQQEGVVQNTAAWHVKYR